MKKLTNIIILFLLIFILASCSEKEKKEKYKKNVTEQLYGHILKVNSLEGKSFITIKDSMMIMNSFSRDSLVVAYKLINGSDLVKIGNAIPRGNGPNEFNNTSYYADKEIFDIINSDGMMTKLSTINIDSLFRKKTTNCLLDKDMKWINPFNYGGCFVRFDNNKILLLGGDYNSRNLLTLINLKTNSKTSLEYWINDSYKGPNIPKQMLYCSNSRIFKNNDKILFACGVGRYLEIIDLLNTDITNRKLIYGFYPIFEKRDDNLNFKIKFNSFRGMNVFTTSTYIFVHLKTYQDEEGVQKSISDFKGYPYYYNDELEVYDWDGNFLKNYQTNIPFYDFFVTEDNKTLFTISQDLNTYEPIMVKYELQFSQ